MPLLLAMSAKSVGSAGPCESGSRVGTHRDVPETAPAASIRPTGCPAAEPLNQHVDGAASQKVQVRQAPIFWQILEHSAGAEASKWSEWEQSSRKHPCVIPKASRFTKRPEPSRDRVETPTSMHAGHSACMASSVDEACRYSCPRASIRAFASDSLTSGRMPSQASPTAKSERSRLKYCSLGSLPSSICTSQTVSCAGVTTHLRESKQLYRKSSTTFTTCAPE